MNRLKIILLVLLPTLLIVCSAMGFYVVSELQTGTTEAFNKLESNIRVFGDNLAKNSGEYAKQVEVVASLMSLPSGTETGRIFRQIFEKHPTITALGVAYDSDFLKEVSQGKHPSFKFEKFYPNDPMSPGQTSYAFIGYRGSEGVVTTASNTIAKTYETADWYLGPKYLRRGKWSYPFPMQLTKEVVCAYGLPFSIDNRFAGVVTCFVSVANWVGSQQPEDLTLLNAGYIVVNPIGRILYHSQTKSTAQFSIYSSASELGRCDIFKELDTIIDQDYGVTCLTLGSQILQPHGRHGGDSLLVYSRIRGNNDWTIITAVDKKMVLKGLYQRLTIFCILAISGVLITCGIVSTILVHANEPVLELSRAAKAVANGDLQTKISSHITKRKDELGAFSRTFNTMIDALNCNIAHQINEADVLARVDQELDVAQEIQESFLPSDGFYFNPDKNFTLQARLVSSPLIAGDFYDFWFLDDDLVAFLIADVDGRGFPSVVSMVSARTLLRQVAHKSMQPGEVLTEVNRILLEEHKNGLFVTVFLAFYNTKTGSFLYSNAGHVPPVILEREGNISYFSYAENLMLGTIPGLTFETKQFTLHTGDILVLYTNGIPNMLSETGEPYNRERFSNFMTQQKNTVTDRIVANVVSDLENWRGSAQIEDDAGLLLLKRTVPLPPCSNDEWSCDEVFQSDYGKGDYIVNDVLKHMEDRGWSERDAFAVNMALVEGLNNAIEHGNALDTTKQVFVRCSVSDNRISVSIRDEGEGFREDKIPDPRLRKRLTNPTGRGVLLIRNFMSCVSFNETGNEIYMDKYRSDFI